MLTEGCTIKKKKEAEVPNTMNFTCPNPSCGRSFKKPLQAINLSEENPEPYLACPHCLIGLTVQEDQPIIEAKSIETGENLAAEQPVTEKTMEQPTTPGCSHYYGYLSKRHGKEGIPEECVSCAQVVDCMMGKAENPAGN